MTKINHQVRQLEEYLPDRAAPSGGGAMSWFREKLFASVRDSIFTVVFGIVAVWSIWKIFYWTAFGATWTGGVDECRANLAGACWPYIKARFNGFVYGFYPHDQQWRVDIVLIVFAIGIAMIAWPRFPKRYLIAAVMIILFPIFSWIMLSGDIFGLEHVSTNYFGGFMVTLLVAVVGNFAALPIGILLALGRRSHLPFIKSICIIFIEFWRGVPLITVLFVAAYILPLFFPQGLNVDQLIRALIGVSLFSGAYMAEVIRGGLQAVDKGQAEAGSSLGLTYWGSMRFIVLPQALKISIPGIVNSFVALFKDTTLLLIINILDVLGMIHAGTRDAEWAAPTVTYTGYVFAAGVFWIFCYGMSLYSRKLEERVGSGLQKNI